MTKPQDTDWFGRVGRECGEHRPLGDHYSWCYECSEKCDDQQPCVRCELPQLRAELVEANRKLAEHGLLAGLTGDGCVPAAAYRDAGDKLGRLRDMATAAYTPLLSTDEVLDVIDDRIPDDGFNYSRGDFDD